MKQEKNYGLTVLVIVLLLLVVGLSGYIVYDKVLKNDDNETTNVVPSDNTSVEDKLPEWAEYLLKQDITEIAVYNRKKSESFKPGDNCLPPEYITKDQLELVLKEMTKATLYKYNNASGFGGVCVGNIIIKYNSMTLEIYDFNFIIPKDDTIKRLIEKEKYIENNSMKGNDEFDDWYSYYWDESYLDTLLG